MELIQKRWIERLSHIGAALSSEHHVDDLLEQIVLAAQELTGAEGGTLFLVDHDHAQLLWTIVQNDPMGIHFGGSSSAKPDPVIFSPIGLDQTNQACVHAALTGESLHIEDVYDEFDAFDFEGPLRFDAQTGYRTTSMLVVPLTHFEVGIIGVLQLINARDPDGAVVPFSEVAQMLTQSLASMASVAVQNARLFETLHLQFEAFIETIAAAIDTKSAYTAGHVRRVVDLTMHIARAVDADTEVFGDVQFDADALDALRIASWMHDIGKIATPEYVVDKATKLSTIHDRIDLVSARYALAQSQARERHAHAMFTLARGGQWTEQAQEAARQELEGELVQMRDELAFLKSCNAGAEFMSQDRVERLADIATRTVLSVDGLCEPILTQDELYNLGIRKGTLTPEEIQVIRDHAKLSYKMLSSLPFERHLQRVPEIAGGHHERPNGTGYPRGIGGDALSIEARILAVADIFEALTAADRPYKKPTPLSGVARILGSMTAHDELDARIVRLAMQAGVFDDYASREVDPSQHDLVFARDVEP